MPRHKKTEKKYTIKQLEKYNSEEWCKLLMSHSQFADWCDKVNGWEQFDPIDWRSLITRHSGNLLVQQQFVDRCDKVDGWKQFDGKSWIRLLTEQPQFADRCDKVNGWAKFSSEDWDDLLPYQPQFADKQTNTEENP